MIARILRVDLILICNRMPCEVLLPDDVMKVVCNPIPASNLRMTFPEIGHMSPKVSLRLSSVQMEWKPYSTQGFSVSNFGYGTPTPALHRGIPGPHQGSMDISKRSSTNNKGERAMGPYDSRINSRRSARKAPFNARRKAPLQATGRLKGPGSRAHNEVAVSNLGPGAVGSERGDDRIP